MREATPGPAASKYAVSALTACTSRNCSAESAPVIAPGTHVRPPSTVRAQVARCPDTHATESLTALTACSSDVVCDSCSTTVTATRASGAGLGGAPRVQAARRTKSAGAMVRMASTLRRVLRGGNGPPRPCPGETQKPESVRPTLRQRHTSLTASPSLGTYVIGVPDQPPP